MARCAFTERTRTEWATRARARGRQAFIEQMREQVSTLRNWEQGRREPTGPAKALLRAIRNDPEHVIRALVHAA